MFEWVWLLVIAGLFYFMMRFGCGGHMAHGNHGNGEHQGSSPHHIEENPNNDPVCGMQVAARQGYSEIYRGREIRFCSRKCLDQFDAEPQRYLA